LYPELTDPVAIEVNIDSAIRREICFSEQILVSQIRAAVLAAAETHNILNGCVGVFVTNDAKIRHINNNYLRHDYPTDVISFAYFRSSLAIEGELIVSVTTAKWEARRLGCSWINEIVLYVIHGTLHLCGMNDLQPNEIVEMRKLEREALNKCGLRDFVKYLKQ
jgi:probable rRNA maturation factor